MASFLKDTEDKINGSKLSRLLIDGGTEALRSTFDRIHPPATLAAALHTRLPILTHLRSKRILNSNQWDKLFPSNEVAPDSKQFDITLLYILLRNICEFNPPATGWENLPLATDRTLEANLARIKYYRNEVYGHISSTGVHNLEFEKYWKEISGALVGLGIDVTSIDMLKSSPQGETDYISVLDEWTASEQAVKQVAEQARKAAEQTKTEIEKLTQEVAKLNSETVQVLPVLSKLAKSDFTGHINEIVKLHHPGTRSWILDQVQQLIQNDQSQVMVITAQPGVGKSVLAAVTCQTMQEQGRLAASHFIEHNNSLRNSPRLITESIASHLCDTLPGFRQKLEERLSRNVGKELNSLNCTELLNLLLEEPLNAVGIPPENWLVVLDALDECDFNQEDEFIKALFRVIPKLPKWMKFLITTRPLKSPLPKIDCVTVVTIEPGNSKNMEDINLYLLHELEKQYPLASLQTVVASLVNRSEGIFLFARFVVEFTREKKLQLSLLPDLFPRGISSVYEEYFSRLVKGLSVEENEFFSFLEAIVAAENPLPESMVLQILGLKGESRKSKKAARDSLKTLSHLFPSQNMHISFFHKSLAEWLTETEDNEHDFSVATKDGHRVLAPLCLKYLQSVKRHSSFPPPVNDCEKYALRFGFRHMLKAGGHEEQLRECVNDLEILTAKYSLTGDEWQGLKSSVLEEVKTVKGAFNWLSEELDQFMENLKLGYPTLLRFNLYPQAILQAAVNCPITNHLRQQSTRLLESPKYKRLGWMEVTPWNVDLSELEMTRFPKLSFSSTVVAFVGEIKTGERIVKTIDVHTRTCIATVVRQKHVYDVAVSPDGRYVAVVSGDCVELLYAQSLQVQRTFTTDSEPWSCCFLPDCSKLIAGYEDCRVRVWDVDSARVQHVLEGHSWEVTLCTSIPDGRVLTGDRIGTLMVWQSLIPPSSLKMADDHDIFSISPDGMLVAVSSYWRNSIRIFSSEDGKLLRSYPVDGCTASLFVDNTRVLCQQLNHLKVLNISSGVRQQFLPPAGTIEALFKLASAKREFAAILSVPSKPFQFISFKLYNLT